MRGYVTSRLCFGFQQYEDQHKLSLWQYYDYCTRHRGISVILLTLVSLCSVNTFLLFLFIINNTASIIIVSIIISYGSL